MVMVAERTSPDDILLTASSTVAKELIAQGRARTEDISVPGKKKGSLKPEDYLAEVMAGNAELAGSGNHFLYSGENARTFAQRVAGLKGNGASSYQQQTGDEAIFTQHSRRISDFIKNAETICLVGPGTCEKELNLIRRCIEELKKSNETLALRRIEIRELSPEYNEHSYFRTVQFARDMGLNIDVKAFQGDFRETSKGVTRDASENVAVLCLGGLTNPEKSPPGSFPSRHYIDFYHGLMRLAGPNGGIMTTFTRAGSDESLSNADREAQIRPIYDHQAFHDFILGAIPANKRHLFKYHGEFDSAGSLFHHYVERIPAPEGSDGYTELQINGHTVSVFPGDRKRILTSTGMNPQKLSTLLHHRLGVDTEGVLTHSDPAIFQTGMIFRAPRYIPD